MNFASDNVYGIHPKILAAIEAANQGTTPSYGYDDYSKRAEDKLSEVFEKEVRAFLVTTGTAANGLALSALTPSYGAVFTHNEAHSAIDECNSPEMFTGGAKIIGLEGVEGKLTPPIIEKVLKGFLRGEHDPKPAALSITNSTELGRVYKPDEIKALSTVAKSRKMKFHTDGARFANAVAALGVKPADITWKAGIDVMSFGGTKNGGMLLEAVVFFDTALAEDFLYRRMRGGQLISKSRFLGTQMLAYLEGGLWLDNARIANGLAQRLAKGLLQSNRIRIPLPVEANEIFAVMPLALHDKLLAAGAHFHQWGLDILGRDGIAEDEVFCRFVLSFATPEADVDRFLSLVKQG
ncbi:threonine aldolase family protein [Aestuariivirga sp. YIM B02566]|uniref:Low specificity L-threonine aldolase n=1 Tax=Taklimakanibacter albus TaxID=2800327 RepID=A0ACC5R5V3_9HYPH|nr:low specificity L-threonine aldolase [Aestuariivirga sp. YIM B02566]MBK1867962.1 low specificity L-threonine aldolase [Aestuariivirga sp. YIM B02566]